MKVTYIYGLDLDKLTEDSPEQFDSVATEFTYSEDLLPERSEILTRLNGFAPVLSEYAGRNIIFE